MKKLAAFFLNLEEGIIVLLLALMVIITFSQVTARYVFNSGWGGALEATTILFQWLVVVGMSLGIKNKTHLGVDFILNLFSDASKRKVTLVVVVLCLTYVVLMFYGSVVYFTKMYQIGIEAQDLPIPRWILISVLPLGLALLGYRLIRALILVWQGKMFQLTASEADIALNHARQEKEDSTSSKHKETYSDVIE